MSWNVGKRTDRVFHITVTVFAMTLTVLSAVSMVYQRNPELVRSWLRAVAQASPVQTVRRSPQGLSGINLTSSLKVPPASKTSVAKPGSAKFTASSTAGADSTVTVQSVASDIPTSTLTEVKQLLTKYAILQTVANTLNMNPQQTVHIYLAQTNADYQQELAALGLSLSDAGRLSKDTGGFTQGDTIIIPMSQNKTVPDLVNTLGHEVTHVFLNHYVTDVPSWINEGLAVHDGMLVQSQTESAVEYSGYAKRMAESVLAATSAGNLVPLTGNEQQVLQGSYSYDLELQDWLAVNWIIQNYGLNEVHDYLHLLKAGVSSSQAFNDAFNIAESTFNTNFTSLLQTAAASPDAGVDLQFAIPKKFHGYIEILQHGTQNWRGFPVNPGSVNVTVTPGGKLEGVKGVQSTLDANPPDNTTLYINLQSNGSLMYQGQTVQDCGFALDYHNGLYSFINSWITPVNGKTVFSRNPSLFNVVLSSVVEHQSSDPILPLLNSQTNVSFVG